MCHNCILLNDQQKDEIRKERERLRRERKEGKEDINDYGMS